MKQYPLALSICAALLIGIAQMWVLLWCWSFIATSTPVPYWLSGLGMTGSHLRVALFPIDFIVSIILCLPGAIALARLRPSKLLLYLILAVVPGFIWQYRLVFTDPTLLHDWTIVVPGMLPLLCALPIAAWLVQRLTPPQVPPAKLTRSRVRGGA